MVRGRLTLLPVWLALIAAGVEVLVVLAQKQVSPLRPLSEDVVWMAPLALVAVAAIACVPLLLFGSDRWNHFGLRAALWVSASAACLDLLMLVPRLHHAAAALLAAGFGWQIARLALRHPDRAFRLATRTAVVLLCGIASAATLRWAQHRRPSVDVVASARSASPNLLLLTLDTVRAASTSLYGYERHTTPRIDAFAERGVVFDAAFAAAPWTLPSHASMFTGRWPHELSTSYSSPLDHRDQTLAEYLAARGYATAGFVANLQYCGAATGLDRGFQSYEDYPRTLGEVASSSTLARNIANNFRVRRLIENDQQLDRVTAEEINARALTWLSNTRDKPFFMFLNYFDAHEPYLPPPPFDRTFGSRRQRGRYSPLHHWLWDPSVGHGNMGEAQRREEVDAYDGAVAYLDAQIGTLLDELNRRRVLDNTIVVITADHGEELGEHRLFDHGYSLYRPALQVPLIVVSPGAPPVVRRVKTAVSLRDLAATLVDVLGVADGASFPGASLASLWRHDGNSTADSHAFSPLLSVVERSPNQPDWFPSSKGDMQSVIADGVHYVKNGDGSEELYDVGSDVWEAQNLVSHPDRVTALTAARTTLQQTLATSHAP